MGAGGRYIFDRARIAAALPHIDMVSVLESAFDNLSMGRAQLAAVGELVFPDPPGDVHIKAGHVVDAPWFVVKVASGFYANPDQGLPSSSGLVLLFNARTGSLGAIMLDEGLLTDARTGGAGAVAARHLAPADPGCIGIIGSGIQAEEQLRYLWGVTGCRDVLIWARRSVAAAEMAEKAIALGYNATVAASVEALAARSRLIVTTTPSQSPLLDAGHIQPGTHITAVGADSAHKAELSPALLAMADLHVADSVVQCRERGEFRRLSAETPIAELGDVVAGRAAGRISADQISIADLTGVAIQDAAVAQAIFNILQSEAQQEEHIDGI